MIESFVNDISLLFAVNDPQFATSAKIGTCILAPACFALGATVFANYEGGLVGVQADNVNDTTANFTYTVCVGMMLFDSVLYGLLAWYFDKTLPSEFGTPLPWYFVFQRSYWCGNTTTVTVKDTKQLIGGGNLSGKCSYKSVHHPLENVVSNTNDHIGQNIDHTAVSVTFADDTTTHNIDNNNHNTKDSHNTYFEPLTSEHKHQIAHKQCVSVRKLRKVYPNAAGGEDRIAVHELNLDLLQGQVTVLLGHNGAGA